MPQQINLCTPILLTQKRYFSAHTMAIALVLLMGVGGVLCGFWVWNLNRASEAFQKSMTAGTREIESLQAAIQLSRANAAPVAPALLAELQERRNALAQRENLKDALIEGMFRPGWGHSDRMAWVASSIPAPTWITQVQMDGQRFEVTGFTLEPAALNDWVNKLSVSPLMKGLKLATVKVENAVNASTAAPLTAALAASAPIDLARAVWSFHLVGVEPPTVLPTLATASAPKGKP